MNEKDEIFSFEYEGEEMIVEITKRKLSVSSCSHHSGSIDVYVTSGHVRCEKNADIKYNFPFILVLTRSEDENGESWEDEVSYSVSVAAEIQPAAVSVKYGWLDDDEYDDDFIEALECFLEDKIQI